MRTPLALRCLIIVGLAVSIASPSAADVLWSWQFGTEQGTFTTDGTLADTSAAGSFTISNFQITASTYPSHVGAAYYETQAPQGFLWDGSVPTQFWRAGGIFTNGSNFFLVMNDWIYLFLPASGIVRNADEDDVYSAALTLTPLREQLTPAVPALSPWGLGLLSLMMAGAGAWLLRR